MKKNMLLLVLAFLAMGAWAQQITEQQAMYRALQFLNTNTALSRRAGSQQLKMHAARVEAQSVYAFNLEGGGYVIASADSRTLPVLGYSDKGSIDWDNMSDNLRGWLKQYDQALATLGNRQDFKDGIALGRPAKMRAAKVAIEPLIKTTWFEFAPYNNKAPLYAGAGEELQGKRCSAGGMAVALAQLMNYYQWPKTCPEIPAYESSSSYDDEEKWWHVDGLPSVTFDWDNMLDTFAEYDGEWELVRTLGTEAQQDAVATLMRYCGQAASINYTPQGSNAYSIMMVDALVRYFCYDDGAQLVGRSQYSIDEWEDLIYGELEGGHPVMYSANNELYYIPFICDGYDGNGLFHINWGWRGRDDGYFSLSLLDPSGFMDSRECTGFNANQEAIINVRPAPEGYQYQQILPAIYLCPDFPVSIVSEDIAYFTFLYAARYSEKDLLTDTAFGTCSDDGTLTPLFMGAPNDSLVVNTTLTELVNIYYVKIDSTAFQPGEQLTLYPMVKFRDQPGAEWQMLGSKQYCIYAGRADNGKFFLYSSVDLYDLEIVKTEFRKGGGQPGVNSELVLTMRNNGESEFMAPIYLSPLYFGNVKPSEITADTPYTEGDYVWGQTLLRPGEEGELSFRITTEEAGTIYLWLWLWDGTDLGGTFVETTATGINGVLSDTPEGRYYDLHGRGLQSRPVRPGIYINNGKKFVVK